MFQTFSLAELTFTTVLFKILSLLSPPIMLQCSVAELLPASQHFDRLVLSIALIMMLLMMMIVTTVKMIMGSICPPHIRPSGLSSPMLRHVWHRPIFRPSLAWTGRMSGNTQEN